MKFRIKHTQHGSVEPTNIQQLQVKRWWGWQTLDSEEVPQHHLIAVGVYGFDHQWTSKFRQYGSFGRDGVFTPTVDETILLRLAR